MKTFLVTLNLLAATLAFLLMNRVEAFEKLQVITMYTEMDRSQMIDHAKIKEAFPGLSDSDSLAISEKLFHRGIPNAAFLGYPCIFIFILNAVLLSTFWKRRTQKAEQDAAANP